MADFGQIFASNSGVLHFNATAGGWSPANIYINITSAETRMILLSDAENCTIISSLVCTKHPNVTDGQTDILWLLQRSALERCRYAVKITGNPSTSTNTSTRILFPRWRHTRLPISVVVAFSPFLLPSFLWVGLVVVGSQWVIFVGDSTKWHRHVGAKERCSWNDGLQLPISHTHKCTWNRANYWTATSKYCAKIAYIYN